MSSFDAAFDAATRVLKPSSVFDEATKALIATAIASAVEAHQSAEASAWEDERRTRYD